MGDNTRKLTMVCLPYVKGLAERIQKICRPYNIRTVFTSDSTLWRYLFRVKPPTEFNMIENSIPCSCGKIYKGETGRPLKVRLVEHRKAVVRRIIWRLQVQSWLQVSNNTCTQLWLTDSEQVTLGDSIMDLVQSSVKVPEFDKHLKKARGHIGRNVVEI